MQHDPLDRIGIQHNEPVLMRRVYTQPNEHWLKRNGKKVISGVACSAAVGFVMHLGVVRVGLTWAASIVLFVFGHPPGSEKLGKLEDKVVHAIEKGKDALHKGSPGEDGQPAVPLVAKALEPVKQAAAPVKEAVAVAKEVKETTEKAAKGVEAVKQTGDKVADAIGRVGDSAKQGMNNMGHGIAETMRARAEAKEKKERDTLEAHAALIGITIDPTWTNPRLKGEILKAEIEHHRKYGINARCPKCRKPFRIKTPRNEMRRCMRCGTIYTDRQAMAAYTPPSIHMFDR